LKKEHPVIDLVLKNAFSTQNFLGEKQTHSD
jgi:hypothetical protein